MAYGMPRLRTTCMAGARDFALALAAMWILVPAVDNLHAPAHATGLPRAPAAGPTLVITPVQAGEADATTLSYARVARNPLRELNGMQAAAISPYFLLSLVIALLTACNLAFLRHLRRAYARGGNGRRRAR